MPRPPRPAASTTFGPRAKKWFNGIGITLGAAGVAFVIFHFAMYADEIDTAGMGGRGYLGIAVVAAVYGVSNILLALGWWYILRHLGIQTTRGWALRTYARSQLAKYVPGNIFQFVGRQAIGVAAGFNNKPLAYSTMAELILLTIGGASFTPLVAPVMVGWDFGIFVGLAAFAVLATIVWWLAVSHGGAALGRASICYLAFIATSGLIFAFAYQIAGGLLTAATLPIVAGAYVVAWLAGMLTPGAPAGLGIREAVLLVLLSGLAAPQVILLAVVIGRTVTVIGDLGFYLAGIFSSNRNQDQT